jgi:8-oxo-dGTP pyrophosphatase MutT (NUDIX family)
MFDVKSSEVLFTGRAFKLRVDQVSIDGNPPVSWEVLEHPGGVSIVPFDEDGNILMVRQYRHAVGVKLLELPAGTLKKGEDPDLTARRELQEEVGMDATNIELIGEFFLAPGYSSELMRVYLATGLFPATLPQDEDEVIAVERVPFNDAVAMALNGQIRDAKSVSGLLLAAHKR